MSVALARFHNMTHVEVQCGMSNLELVALQQMIAVNTGIETLHLHVTDLDAITAPLDLATATMINPKSKLAAINLEGEDKNPNTKKMRDIDLKEWQEVVAGVFKIVSSNTVESYILSLNKV